MKTYLLLFIACFFSLFGAAQAPYFQQQTDYTIEVKLNDTVHVLEGFITIDYTNNSAQSLPYIIFHLWPNAYRDQTTPLAKQLLENGRTDFYFSKTYQQGFIDHLDFKADAEICQWEYDSSSLEIAKVYLNKPLNAGETVRISTPFRVKLPETFSRMGHVGQSYQITQWYPKPAVFDNTGWHAMPYLDQGEFYSEYGSYDVQITLPQNYVVGATGDLQTVEEIKWMDSLAAENQKITQFVDAPSLPFPASSSSYKTIRFKQNNIHDFGWFADKRYRVLKGEVELPTSKRKVITWSLFTDNQASLWSKAPMYLHDAMYYYSKWIGEYPYNQVTAVDGTINAGGGMEYPNVTIIGEASSDFALDDVITHEVGHNWFYGILGSNERDHAWMDEGINSFYEQRYINTKYPYQKLVGDFNPGLAKAFDVNQYQHKYISDLGYQFMARDNADQAIEQTSAQFTNLNYGAMVYGKSMLILEYLQAYLGPPKFDSIMQKYFELWKFKHPQPSDFRSLFEKETGKNLSWFFDDLLGSTKKIDFKISSVARNINGVTVGIKNVGQITSPVSISLLNHDSIIATKWLDKVDYKNKKSTNIDFTTSLNYNKIQIDPQLQIPEINRRNNTYFINKKAHFFERLRFQFLGSAENQNRTQVFFAPYLGWNNYDKTQVGIAIYSPFFPNRKFSYLVAPAIGTGSKQFIGIAKFSYHFYPNKIQRFTLGINGKRFSYILFPQPLMFHKLEPYLAIEFKKKNGRSTFTHLLQIRSVLVWLDWIRLDTKKKATMNYFVNEVKYNLEQNSTRNPFTIEAKLRAGKSFANLAAEANFLISYKRKNEGLSIRIFAGGFIVNTKSTSDITAPNAKFYLSNATTNTFAYWLQRDYMLDENFIDRNGRDKYLSRQIAKTDGAFRSFTTFGATNKFLLAANITSSTHRYFPIQPFINAAFILNDLNKPQFAAELGLSAVLLRDMLEIHLPLVTTKNISDNQKVLGINKVYQKFTFTLKLKMVKPMDVLKRLM